MGGGARAATGQKRGVWWGKGWEPLIYKIILIQILLIVPLTFMVHRSYAFCKKGNEKITRGMGRHLLTINVNYAAQRIMFHIYCDSENVECFVSHGNYNMDTLLPFDICQLQLFFVITNRDKTSWSLSIFSIVR